MARNHVTRFGIASVLAAVFATASAGADPQPNEAASVSAAKLHALRASGVAPVVIDVRTSEEYASGHIPGAVNIPFVQVARRRPVLHGRAPSPQG